MDRAPTWSRKGRVMLIVTNNRIISYSPSYLIFHVQVWRIFKDGGSRGGNEFVLFANSSDSAQIRTRIDTLTSKVELGKARLESL